MTETPEFAPFIQLHFLTFYPPSNPNRDDAGRPKTAVVGGHPRQRISSQALKRAWRTSAVFERTLEGHLAKRTQRIGREVAAHLVSCGIDEVRATATAREIASIFGKVKADKDKTPLDIEQLAFISPEERAAALKLAEERARGANDAKAETLADGLLLAKDKAADIAMFGRMLADSPKFNREAAVAVSHAFTTNRVVVEDDYYTAVDDLKLPSEDAGAGFIGEAGFGSGVYYLYVVIDRRLLLDNLAGDRDVARKAIAGLIGAASSVGPGGKIKSFANHARTSYLLAERGGAAPRSLAAAFIEPVDRREPKPNDLLGASIAALRDTRQKFAQAYPEETLASVEMDVLGGTGTLKDILSFAIEGL